MAAKLYPSISIVKYAIALTLFCLSSTSKAQNEHMIPFNGIVTDIAGNPIKKVKIYNLNEKRYALTNKEGKFGLTNVKATDTLHIVYNKTRYDIPVEGRRSMKIRLADQLEEVTEDEELVNLGMAFVKRREYTGATSGLRGEELIRMGYTKITDAIVGTVPGVQLFNGKLIIRGVNSINLPLDPLFIVDGIEVQSLDTVSLYEVDRIDVIKDSNMYGVKGANGVIVITTKRGAN